ncbi:hypothetical protein [Sorangium sp. So ce1000]|uniref:hypothetical protein n=1 Tax=Sorangium sp. So ce1000 TaxID=3133325 RepID=UPI003F6171F3
MRAPRGPGRGLRGASAADAARVAAAGERVTHVERRPDGLSRRGAVSRWMKPQRIASPGRTTGTLVSGFPT